LVRGLGLLSLNHICASIDKYGVFLAVLMILSLCAAALPNRIISIVSDWLFFLMSVFALQELSELLLISFSDAMKILFIALCGNDSNIVLLSCSFLGLPFKIFSKITKALLLTLIFEYREMKILESRALVV
jgi:hypothetical protein